MKVKIKVRSGKGGTKLAAMQLRATPTEGKPKKIAKEIYRSRAQVYTTIWTDKNGEPRRV